MPTRKITLTAALLCTATVGGALTTTAASAKTWKATGSDPTGDAPVPGRDITEVKFRYKSNGSVLFVITTAGPIDGAGADASVAVTLGTTCNKLVLTGVGLFSEPNPVAFVKVKGKKTSKPIEGDGEITGNVYTLKAKHSSLKGIKPGCFAVAFGDPAAADTNNPQIFDLTDEFKIKK